MDRNEGTNNPKNPRHAVPHPKAHSAALWAFIGSLAVFFMLIGLTVILWTFAHPLPVAREGMEGVNVMGRSGYYWTEGGHDPLENRRPRTTQAELKFRGELTPPSEAQHN